MYHPEITRQLGQLREAEARAAAARERAIHAAPVTGRQLTNRRLVLAMAAAAPIALWLAWVLVAHWVAL